jgi:drug/metabolite transporter (DMT)-like permease
MAVLSAATFGTSGTFARSLINAGWTAETAVTARISIASLILAVPTVWAMRGRWLTLRRSLATMAPFGVLAVAGAQLAFFTSLEYVPVGVALLLEYSGILLVVTWMWLVHGERPRPLTWAGATAAIAGLALVLDLAGAQGLDPLGIAWGLGAGVGLAAYFVLSARIDTELPSVALASGGMAVGAVVLLALGATGILRLHATNAAVTFAGHQVSWLVPVAGLSVIAAVVAFVAGIGAARVLGAGLASFVGLTEVLFAIVFAWLALGEVPTLVQAMGGILIIAGIALVRAGMLGPEVAGTATVSSPTVGRHAPQPEADRQRNVVGHVHAATVGQSDRLGEQQAAVHHRKPGLVTQDEGIVDTLPGRSRR